MNFEYTVIIEPLPPEEGRGYSARADGATPEEAITNIQDAIATWIEGMREIGREVPSPVRLASEPTLERA